MIEMKEIEEITWIKSKFQVADVLTKEGVKKENILQLIRNL